MKQVNFENRSRNRKESLSKNYNYKEFPYKTPDELNEKKQKIKPVAIVGAGPILSLIHI